MAGTRTSGIIWISVVLMAAAITTSTLGLFMDSWRTFDAVDEDKEKIDGWKGSTGLNTIVFEYDFKEFNDGYYEDDCNSDFEENVSTSGIEVECKDKNTFVMSIDISDACEDEEERLEEIEEYEDEDSEYVQNQRDEVDSVCQTENAGTTGSILLWVGFGTAILAMVLCIISAFVSNSGLRMSAGLIGNFSGLFMSASAILWLTLLPNEDIDINEGEWDLGVNFILTLVGGFLAVVAGIIALNAKKRRGRKRYNYHMPQQQNFQQQNFQQQNFQQQNFQQQNYQQQNYQQQQQFYEQQNQQYQQPDPYQRW
tara:strand:- start:420 stop:1352 length:933 start_codon:yes stop_codon:yes gene_type:complete